MIYLFSDHLGSTSVAYRPSDGWTTRQWYRPWGELRPGPDNELPTDYTFTGQREAEVLGMLWYNSRFYDPTLGRYSQPDSIVPNPFYSLALDRYQYVFLNPLKYVDPSGHKACDDFGPNGECILDPLWHPSSNILSGWEKIPEGINQPVYSYEQGLKFLSWLNRNPGWWSKYMTNLKRTWRFLIALAYGYELEGTSTNKNVRDLAPQAFANKFNDMVSKYGDAGYYVLLGSMHTIRERIGANIFRPGNLDDAFTMTSGVLNGSLSSSDPNAPYDFANPMPGKHPEDLLTRLYDFANACQDNANGCETRKLEGTLYVLASWNNVDGNWAIFFIVSYTQEMSWK